MLNKGILMICLQDFLGLRQKIQTNQAHLHASLNWLKRAQNINMSGGVSAGYSLLKGWLPEYIETTGYIISSFLEASLFLKDDSYRSRAEKMADYLVSMQLTDGGFKTYPHPLKGSYEPTIFNTGQDLIGMVDIYKATHRKKYLLSLIRSAEFLISVQNNNGTWTKYSYDGKAHSYDSRVSLAILKAYKITKNRRYLSSGIKNLDWTVSLQTKNGWFEDAYLPHPNPSDPYTHTLAYTIEGLLLSGLEIRNGKWIRVAKKTADKLLTYFLKNNFLPGTLDRKWVSSDRYSCLSGDAQISGIWLRFYLLTKDHKYLKASKMLNAYLKSTQQIDNGDINITGGIKGCEPIYGDLLKMEGYCRMTYINWAAKFFVDALLLEELISSGKAPVYL